VVEGSGRGAGRKRETAGQRWEGKHCGTPQGGVISPLLANLYMNRFLKYWRITGRSEVFRARVINYADDCAPRAHLEMLVTLW